MYTQIYSSRKSLVVIFASLLLLFFAIKELAAILTVVLLTLFASFGQIYKRYVKITSAIEFVTFGTIIIAISYGWVAAVLFALATSFAAEVISGNIDAYLMIYLPVRLLSAVFAAFLATTGMGVISIGLATVFFVNILSQPIYLLNSDTEVRMRGLVYVIVNLVFNIVLLNLLGEQVVSLVA